MKYLIKLISSMSFILIIGGYSLVYAVDRFVDIPTPPNSSGKADFTSEDGEKEAERYQEKKALENEINNNTIEKYIEKSGNNYLKNLSIKGYRLEPQFNAQVDEYTVYIPDISTMTNLNIIAEPNDIKATIQGSGNVAITENTNTININVIAENGNLKVYTIKIEEFKEEKSMSLIIVITVIITMIIIIGIIKNKNSKKI